MLLARIYRQNAQPATCTDGCEPEDGVCLPSRVMSYKWRLLSNTSFRPVTTAKREANSPTRVASSVPDSTSETPARRPNRSRMKLSARTAQ